MMIKMRWATLVDPHLVGPRKRICRASKMGLFGKYRGLPILGELRHISRYRDVTSKYVVIKGKYKGTRPIQDGSSSLSVSKVSLLPYQRHLSGLRKRLTPPTTDRSVFSTGSLKTGFEENV
ncbi:unnamed protein product [Owenia fusiformis]|uniref:Uncharacterized protein n=1 Tax=Owenia fusiformis TaxID=6347 RepID=A0A8S4PXS8_OWEFU|nr:unnamed protein product [Owenia fusiformis]